MGFTKPPLPTPSSLASSSSTRLFIFLLIFLLSLPVLLLTANPQFIDVIHLETRSPRVSFPPPNKVTLPEWLEVIRGTDQAHQKPTRVGLVNFEGTTTPFIISQPLHGLVESVSINFESVSPNVTWKSLFPEWINENKIGESCPDIPMPEPRKYLGLNVVVAKLPCSNRDNDQKYNNGTHTVNEGIRDVNRLQVSLATGRLVVENALSKDNYRDVYAVFIGKCEPMLEIFRCDDLVWHEGEYWVYKPKVQKLREIISMPVGSCDLAPPNYLEAPGSSELQSIQITPSSINNIQQPREAYVTVLHSSEDYVCGAIALAQSILQTNSTKELVLLADRTLSDHSIAGLKAAGWKIKRIDRIKSPNARINAYNEWNYSKLRVWQLTEYDKIMFIDSDFIVVRNIDHFFRYPQVSAAPNNNWIFNSGIMIIEPSECVFDHLMSKRYTLKSYNGGDQGYLNEVFTWWHRLTTKLNFMKFYKKQGGARLVPKDRYTIHFLGLKPWKCYRDYDCNWDRKEYQQFASDAAHARWWQVYDAMPMELQPYCRMPKELDSKIRKRREGAQRAKFYDGHWKIQLKDPRQYQLVNST